jgi:putative MFS transporter
VLVGLGLFFDSFDNTLSSAVLASMLPTGFSTLELNSFFLSATFAGLAIGAAFSGWLSDRIGSRLRFPVQPGALRNPGCGCGLCTQHGSPHRSATPDGIGMGAEYVICYGMITEFFPRGHRGKYLGLLGVFGGFGVSLSSLIGWLVIPAFSWRAMFIIGGVGALIAWWLRRKMPESPRWLESRGRHEEAEAVLREDREGIGRFEPEGQLPHCRSLRSVNDQKAEYVPITVLFSRSVIRRTLLALVLTVICLFGSYSVTGWMPTFFVKQGMTVYIVPGVQRGHHVRLRIAGPLCACCSLTASGGAVALSSRERSRQSLPASTRS